MIPNYFEKKPANFCEIFNGPQTHALKTKKLQIAMFWFQQHIFSSFQQNIVQNIRLIYHQNDGIKASSPVLQPDAANQKGESSGERNPWSPVKSATSNANRRSPPALQIRYSTPFATRKAQPPRPCKSISPKTSFYNRFSNGSSNCSFKAQAVSFKENTANQCKCLLFVICVWSRLMRPEPANLIGETC